MDQGKLIIFLLRDDTSLVDTSGTWISYSF